MRSKIDKCFPEIEIKNVYRAWPRPSMQIIRSEDITVGITFKDDPGYLKVKTDAGGAQVKVIPYITKSTLRREPVDMKFELEQTIDEFFSNGPDINKVQVEHSLEGESLNKAVHLLRCFAGWANSSGSYYGRSTILA